MSNSAGHVWGMSSQNYWADLTDEQREILKPLFLGQDGQGCLLSLQGVERLPEVPLQEPTRQQRLKWECDLFSIPATGHVLGTARGHCMRDVLPGVKAGRLSGRRSHHLRASY